MSELQIKTTDDVYQFVERLESECRIHEATALLRQLDAARHLGSSGLEILGAVRQALVDNLALIEQLLGPSGKEQAKQIVAFVDGAFGR